MSLSHRDLLDHSILMLETFETGEQAVDSFLDGYVEHMRRFRELPDNDEKKTIATTTNNIA